MINPDKYIRKAFADRLTSKGILIYDEEIPNDIVAPPRYVLIGTQTKVKVRAGRGCEYWDCTINLDVYSVSSRSFVSTADIDDYEEVILNAIVREAVPIQNFSVSYMDLDGTPKEIPVSSDTQSIQRKVMTYRIKLEQGENALANVRFLEDGSVRLLEN